MGNPPKPNRRWFQYSLLSLLVLTTFIAAAMAVWSNSARRQRDAVAALKKLDAEVTYDFEEHGLKRPPYWPAWLVDALGIDYFAKVDTVALSDEYELSKSKATDANLELLKCLIGLRRLFLHIRHVTDVGVEKLKGLTALQRLDLGGTQVTDAGLEHLKGLTALQELNLGATRITDAGLKHLKNLTALRMLELDHTKVTEAGVARLQYSLPNCEMDTSFPYDIPP